MEQKSDAAPARQGRRAPLYRYSGFWFALALISAIGSTAVMIAEDPRDPYDTAGISSADAWLRPTHPGRARQMNKLRADLNGVAVSKDGKTVWVAGNAGLIAMSADGGDHWQQETISASAPVPAPPPAAITETASATSTTDAALTSTASSDFSSLDTSGTISRSSSTKKH
jgi:hypothetical protein